MAKVATDDVEGGREPPPSTVGATSLSWFVMHQINAKTCPHEEEEDGRPTGQANGEQRCAVACVVQYNKA